MEEDGDLVMKNRIWLLCVGAGILMPLFLLVVGGYLTSTNAAGDCSLFFRSYGVGLLFPGVLFLCGGLWLRSDKGPLARILMLMFAIPASASTIAILTSSFWSARWLSVFTMGQAISWSIALMFGIGLWIRQLRRPMVDNVQG